jgi:thioredoxin-like negative regulator of GroEL
MITATALLIGTLGVMGAPNVAATIQAMTDAKHTCDAELPKLQAASATDAAAHVDVADCLYRLGRLDEARAGLESAWPGAEPALTTDQRARGLVLLVILWARAGESARATAALRVLEGVPGDRGAAVHRGRAVWMASNGRPAEAWPIVDAALARWPSDPDVIRAAAEVASLDPRHVTPAAEAAISRPADVVAHHNRGVAALNTGNGAACLQEVELGLTKAGDGEKNPLLELGYSCAVQAEAVAAASRLMMARRSVTAFPPASVVRHAELLLESDQAKAAGRLLDLVQPKVEQLQIDRDSLRIRAALAAEDLDAAVAVAKDGKAHPESRANLGVALHKAGRTDDARAVLTTACEELRGRDKRDCVDFLERLASTK